MPPKYTKYFWRKLPDDMGKMFSIPFILLTGKTETTSYPIGTTSTPSPTTGKLIKIPMLYNQQNNWTKTRGMSYTIQKQSQLMIANGRKMHYI